MPELYSTNSVGLHFREVVAKKKKTKIGNLNGQEIYGGKKTGVRGHLGQNFKNTIISSNFSLKLL